MKKFDEMRLYSWIELAIWLLIISLCVFGIKYHHHKSLKQYKSYQIFMNDVDGLIVGSPVRFLGTHIGHVTKIQLVSSDVYSDIYVKFIITQKNLTLPTGSIATVEGSGLGGSKSLEIYPPENEKVSKIIESKDSTRLNKVMGLFNKMFKNIEEIFTNLAHTGKEISTVKIDKAEKNVVTPAQREERLTKFNKQLDTYIEKEKEFRNKYLKEKQPQPVIEEDTESQEE